LVLPARSDCGSWWKDDLGLWSADPEFDPCLKALKGYESPSCFGCKITGDIDHKAWRRHAERCYYLAPGYTFGLHSKYEWTRQQGRCDSLLVSALKLTPGAGIYCELLVKSEAFAGLDFDESLTRMLGLCEENFLNDTVAWFDEEGGFSFTGESLKAKHKEKEGMTIAQRLLRRVDGRGSDVRVDTQEVFRMNAWPRSTVRMTRWRWKRLTAVRFKYSQHINVLELRMYLYMARWRGRHSRYMNTRWLHFLDSQVSLAVLAKGRSSSKQLNKLLRKISSILCARNMYGLNAFTQSRDNPADEGSRIGHAS
jgi:hypothetical protein